MEDGFELVVKTEKLTKRFGRLVAVKDLDLEVRKGEVFGFLGPNGSGKSTTVGMLLGLIAPTSGKAEVFGLNARNNLPRILPRVGAMTENNGFYPYLSGRENLEYFANITGGVEVTRIDEVLEIVDLKSREKDPFKNYSMGMKQRLAVACALLNDPEFIILDEPTNGLDPAGMKEIRELIIRLGEEGKTILLNSHLLHEVEQVCSRVAIIKKGTVIKQGPVDELLNTGDVFILRTTDMAKTVALLGPADWVKSVTQRDDSLLVGMDQERAVDVSRLLAENGVYISELKMEENTLEQIFLDLTEEKADV